MGWFEKKNKKYCSGRLEEELSGLYPGIHIGNRIREFYREKIESAIKVGMLGAVFALCCIGKQMMSDDLENNRYLERRPVGDGDREVVLDALIGDETIEDVVITVGEQEISEQEKEVLLSEVEEQLEEVIRGSNESLRYVNQPLNLLTEWENTEVSIDWTSSNYKVLKDDGCFGEEDIPKEGIEVEITAFISLDEMQREKTITVKVFPEEKPAEEARKEELLQIVRQSEEKSRTGEYVELPEEFYGVPICWEEKSDTPVIFMVMVPIVAVIAVIMGKDREIHKQYLERNRQLLLEYSELVSKLQLLIGAGMSIRNAFKRLALDYQKRREAGGKKRFVYEEVMMTVRKLENGASEEEAYDYFAKRCNPACYRKLVSIIIQNQKKGTEGLKESLLVETRNAFEERKQEARRLGEEAGTKLLLPMMMMMGVVLMIIVIPAYFSFGGI